MASNAKFCLTGPGGSVQLWNGDPDWLVDIFGRAVGATLHLGRCTFFLLPR